MMTARIPSLELAWLPMSERKGMPTPEVRFLDRIDSASGYYLRRGGRNDDYSHTGRRDVLVIGAHGTDRAATIAHEFRHMQQHYVLALPRIGDSPTIDFGTTTEEWERGLRIFYRRPWEFDALRFERRLAPDHSNDTGFFWRTQ